MVLAEKGSVPVIRSEDHIENGARAALTRSNRVGMLRRVVDNTYHYVLLPLGREEAIALGLSITEPGPDLVGFSQAAQT